MAMKALVYEGPREMNIRQVPVPEPAEDEILIRVEKVGICGSELSGYLGQNSLRKPPIVMGHEFSGVVAAAGAHVRRFQTGDRVVVNPLVSCGHCEKCRLGYGNLCDSRVLAGAGRPGAYAEYVAVPEKNVFLLPAHVSFDVGALAEPFACAIRICRLAQIDSLKRVLVLGAGTIGLFVLTAARLFGASDVVVQDMNPDRLEIAESLGGQGVRSPEALAAVRPSGGFDIAVDAVGLEITRRQCVESAKLGGTAVFSGLHSAESALPVNQLIRNEIKIMGSFAYTPYDFHLALEWIAGGKLRIEPWIEYLPLEQGKAGFEKLLGSPGKTAKILLTI